MVGTFATINERTGKGYDEQAPSTTVAQQTSAIAVHLSMLANSFASVSIAA
jgi:hypothetical protein